MQRYIVESFHYDCFTGSDTQQFSFNSYVEALAFYETKKQNDWDHGDAYRYTKEPRKVDQPEAVHPILNDMLPY